MHNFLQRAADKLGYNREFFVEKDTPEDMSDVEVLVLYGDIRSLSIFSTLVFNEYKKHSKKYTIIVSWTGFRFLFPQANEFWSLKSASTNRLLANHANDVTNSSDTLVTTIRGLNYYFEDVNQDLALDYYRNGFTSRYFREFGDIHRFLPSLPSLGNFELQLKGKKNKVVVFPVNNINLWRGKRLGKLDVSRDFWIYLVKRLIQEDFTPVLYQNYFTYDLSPNFTDQCVYLPQEKVLSAIREVDCVLDIFSGISRFAALARCGAVVVDEHQRYIDQKDDQYDALFFKPDCKSYIYSFPLVVAEDDEQAWKAGFVDNLINKLKEMKTNLSNCELDSCDKIDDIVSASVLQNVASKKFGLKMFKKTEV